MDIPFSPDALSSLISSARSHGKHTDLREGEEEKCVFHSLVYSESKPCLSQPLTAAHALFFCSKGGNPGAAGLDLSFAVSWQYSLFVLRFPHLESLGM